MNMCIIDIEHVRCICLISATMPHARRGAFHRQSVSPEHPSGNLQYPSEYTLTENPKACLKSQFAIPV